MKNKVTTRPGESSADACRRRGWKAGDRIVGCAHWGTTVVEITAVGKKLILGEIISENGKPPDFTYECTWTLSCRDWKKVRKPYATGVKGA